MNLLPPAGDREILSVSELNSLVRELLEENFPEVWVKGEISNFLLHGSGHMYFSLKDEKSQIRAVMFRSMNAGLTFKPENGLEVVARGKISVYERLGQHQLYVEEMIPYGLGVLQAAFEALKRKLASEGLFDPARKAELPRYPEAVGVITSPTGAAVRDIVKVLRRRQPWTRIVLRPSLVQGREAAKDIAQALGEMNEFGGVDVIIVGRGGGSIEDLWAFNEEEVARAIARSCIPVVSAVGHEIDFTISDMVADVRAPTPSAAAEMVVPDHSETRQHVASLVLRIQSQIRNRLDLVRGRLEALLRSYGLRKPEGTLDQHRQHLDELQEKVRYLVVHEIDRRRMTIEHLLKNLQSLDPKQVLRRGYSICRRAADGRLVMSSAQLVAGEKLQLSFHRGGAFCRVEKRTVEKEGSSAATQETIF